MTASWLSRRDMLKLGVAGAGFASLSSTAIVGRNMRPSITIAAKDFPEQWILSELLSRQLANATSEHAGRANLAGTMLCHEAVLSGDALCYVEYTGTGLTVVLDREPLTDPDTIYDIVQREYRERFGLRWLGRLGFDNTYAILVQRDYAQQHQLSRISDLQRVQADAGMAMQFEFHDRADGYHGLIKAYELHFGRSPMQMSLGNVYRAVASGDIDIGVGNSTDGLIAHLNLVMLVDDQNYFPPYQAAPIVRADTNPAVIAAIDTYTGAITTEQMRLANYQVDNGKRHPRPVANELARELENKLAGRLSPTRGTPWTPSQRP